MHNTLSLTDHSSINERENRGFKAQGTPRINTKIAKKSSKKNIEVVVSASVTRNKANGVSSLYEIWDLKSRPIPALA